MAATVGQTLSRLPEPGTLNVRHEERCSARERKIQHGHRDRINVQCHVKWRESPTVT